MTSSLRRSAAVGCASLLALCVLGSTAEAKQPSFVGTPGRILGRIFGGPVEAVRHIRLSGAFGQLMRQNPQLATTFYEVRAPGAGGRFVKRAGTALMVAMTGLLWHLGAEPNTVAWWGLPAGVLLALTPADWASDHAVARRAVVKRALRASIAVDPQLTAAYGQ
ncbi:MAG: hypothetical protein IT371_04075 [Deltaproteobacteria bacterium]|nr:hypothetical protein [Deltaproteobacteria bacterium]